MSVKERLAGDLKEAMRRRDERARNVLRMTIAALHNAEIAAGHELAEGDELAVLSKEAKQRRDSIEEFRKAGRADRVEQEEAELALLTAYLPQRVSRDEIVEAARQVIAETGASGARDIGKVMPALMERFRGRADGKDVNAVVRELLGS
jgi:hypothetical protein